MFNINLTKVGLSSILATTLLIQSGVVDVHAEGNNKEVTKEVKKEEIKGSKEVKKEESKSSKEAIKLAEDFYNKGNIKVLKDNGFKVIDKGGGYYTAVKEGVAVILTPNQAKEMGSKVDKKYLKEDIKTTENKTTESKVSSDNTLLNGKDNKVKKEKDISEDEGRTVVRKELNWWVISGIGLLVLLLIGVVFVPTKSDNDRKLKKKPKVK